MARRYTRRMSEITSVSGPAVPLLLDDIDTDRIIPARYLRCVTFDGLGEFAFEDDRRQDADHPFNQDRFQDAKILLAGQNFGCGSSREHAPQSLMRWGIEAVVAEGFAEIFFGNCTGLGVPCVTASCEDLERLAAAVEADPTLTTTVDLEAMKVTAGDVTAAVKMPEAAREALLRGTFDFLAELLSHEADIRATAASLPYVGGYKA